jgi:hypothetical protein
MTWICLQVQEEEQEEEEEECPRTSSLIKEAHL